MTYKTHMAFASALALPMSLAIDGMFDKLVFMGFVLLGSLAPDLDEEGSYLSRKLPVFPMFFKLFNVKHRGVTHMGISIVFILLTEIVLYFVYGGGVSAICGYAGFLVGWILHIAGDLFTKGGVNNFFYPFSTVKAVLAARKYRFYTNSGTEYAVFALLIAINFAEIYYMTVVVNYGRLF